MQASDASHTIGGNWTRLRQINWSTRGTQREWQRTGGEISNKFAFEITRFSSYARSYHLYLKSSPLDPRDLKFEARNSSKPRKKSRNRISREQRRNGRSMERDPSSNTLWTLPFSLDKGKIQQTTYADAPSSNLPASVTSSTLFTSTIISSRLVPFKIRST